VRRLARRYGPAVLGLAVVGSIFGFVLPRIASYRDVIDVISGLSGWDVAGLAAVTAGNVVTMATPWRAAVPGLGVVRALVMTQASSAAASAMPGGEAVGLGLVFGMLRTWGFRRSAVIAAAAVVTAFNTLAKVLLPVVALVGLLVTGRQGGLLGLLTVAGVVVVTLVLGGAIGAFRTDASTRVFGARLERQLKRVPLLRRLTASGPIGDRLSHFRAETIGLLRRRWKPLTFWILIGHVAVFVVLLVSLRAVGVDQDDVALVEAFAAWTLTRLLTAVPITPGGIGIVELGLTGALVAAGGQNDEVVAAVLLYRLLTWLPPIVLGAPAALFWRRLHPGPPGP
jgi:putative heme transporter